MMGSDGHDEHVLNLDLGDGRRSLPKVTELYTEDNICKLYLKNGVKKKAPMKDKALKRVLSAPFYR